jgi:uncharacterized protein (DUF305 family)
MPTSRLTRWILGVLSVIALIAVGYVGGLVTPSLRAPGTNSAEAGFARDMSTHHAQAVAMGMLEYQNGSNADIRQLAYDIALTQQNQIGQMAVWLQDWHLLPTGSDKPMAWMPGGPVPLVNGLMPGMASVSQINQLTTTKGNAEDVLFCQLMLRHHEGGIHMVEGILQLTHNSQVRTLAQTMLNDQEGEVLVLQNDLKMLGAQPLSG